jgi:hypothetical protein
MYGASRAALLEKVGHMNQIAGFKRYVFKEGKKEGVNAVDIWNGAGIYLTILCDRASDISSLTFKGNSLCWLSNLGTASPLYSENGRYAWNDNFSGGMMATCGLTTAGLPSVDAGEQLNLHGPISNLPSEEINCRSYWDGDDYFVEYSSKTFQSKPFAETLCLTRTITVEMGGSTIYVRDNVENLGFEKIPFMMIYHMNFGYPLLDENCRLYLTYDKRYPTSELARADEAGIGVISKPDDGYLPRAYNHTVTQDKDGFAYSSVVNEPLALGATIKFKADELDKFNLWKCLQKRNYVVGLEPCNCRTWGRGRERENHSLPFISPLESRSLYFELQIHEGAAQLAEAVKRYESRL